MTTHESNSSGHTGNRPGDLFNSSASWAAILEPAGWKALRQHGSTTYWQRPGKSGPGISATTDPEHCDVLYVFSSNAYPFEPETSYTKFGAYALLKFNCDFRLAAQWLSARSRAAAAIAI